MKKKKLVIGMVAIVVAFALNLNYANNGYGYGTIYADGTGTYVGQYECDTDVEGHIVMCKSREATGPQALYCPYYRKAFFATVKLKSGARRIIYGPHYEGWNSLILSMDCDSTAFLREDWTIIQIYSVSSSYPENTGERNVNCETDYDPQSRCTIIHHECSDLPTSIISAFS